MSASESYGIPKKPSVTLRLTDEELSGKIIITRQEYNLVRKKINAQYYMYPEKYGNTIYSAELSAYYDFDIIEFDNYIITNKTEIKE